jgi:hypothetical protein
LIDQVKDLKVVAIIGNVKNAGKTTVLNFLLTNLSQSETAITSIGLDGEAIDQVTFLPKPRIFVTAGSLVATAEECLKTTEAGYEILLRTSIVTALGPIVIIRIIAPGNCLVAGPSTIEEMSELIRVLKKYPTKRVLIDGAFSRQTPAILADATILVIGADYSRDIEKVVEDASFKVRQLSLPYAGDDLRFLAGENTLVAIMKDGSIQRFPERSTLVDPQRILERIDGHTRALYCPKTLGSRFLHAYLKQNLSITLIIPSPIHMHCDEALNRRMDQWEKSIKVIHPIRLLAVCINPTSPKGYEFPKKLFSERLTKALPIPVFNVCDDEGGKDE